MEQHSTLRRHAGLVDDMARTLDIDIEEAVLGGKMEFDAVAESVLRCTGCSHPDRCAAMLAAGRKLTAAPDFCQNRKLMEQLRPVPA